uniref:Uncharacterized protein n=1 Tax=Alexandrium monilatum TaxID=311494 RepID=A0A7S4VWX5_9DINO
MHPVLQGILRCDRGSTARAPPSAENTPVLHRMFSRLDADAWRPTMDVMLPSSSSAQEDPCQDPVGLWNDLRSATDDVAESNLKLHQFLLVSDGLPITAMSGVDASMVAALRCCLGTLRDQLALVDERLRSLCGKCNAWYARQHKSAAFLNWQANYDSVRGEVDEIHAAVASASSRILQALNFLHARSSSANARESRKRAWPISSTSRAARLKQD